MSQERRYYHTELAFNYRMANIQAALGLAQLEQIDAFLEKKQLINDWYREVLKDVPNIHLNYEQPGTKNVKWLTCLILESTCLITREELGKKLLSRGIDWRPFFVSMHELPHMAKLKKFGKNIIDCPVALQNSTHGLNLPSGCTLDEPTITEIALTIRDILR